jgi:serine/threonine protein kinase
MSHPSIMRLRHAFVEKDTTRSLNVCLVMDRASPGTLSQYLQQAARRGDWFGGAGGGVGAQRVRSLMFQLLCGMRYLCQVRGRLTHSHSPHGNGTDGAHCISLPGGCAAPRHQTGEPLHL